MSALPRAFFHWHREPDAALIAAARAEAIPAAVRGLWTVTKFSLDRPFPKPVRQHSQQSYLMPAGTYTQLWRMTEGKLMFPYGDLVMQDTPDELATHLDFMRRARGRVLITGLGLGCVARGCLANPRVESVTVIERDPAVLHLVQPHLPETPRLRLVVADAVAWCKVTDERFDCAWHDLWPDPDKQEPALALIHMDMVLALRRKVGWQGAWQMPPGYRRVIKRLFSQ